MIPLRTRVLILAGVTLYGGAGYLAIGVWPMLAPIYGASMAGLLTALIGLIWMEC